MNRRLGIAIAAIVSVMSGIVGWSSAQSRRQSEMLRVRALELIDTDGKVRAQLNVEQGGEVVFRLRDAKGTIRFKLGASETGSAMVMMDEKTEPAVHVLAKPESPSLTLRRGDRRRTVSP